MVKIILAFLFSFPTFALEGTVTVLEAPIFAIPDKTTPVVQYTRKGDSVYIHKQEAFKDKYLGEISETSLGYELKKDNDPLLGDKEIYLPKDDNLFYKIVTKSGSIGYILKEHIFVQYNDTRELTQEVTKNDNTDYRIEEPLPPSFPFLVETGYRGMFFFSLGQPNYQAYPYKQRIRDSSNELIKEFNFVWSKAEKTDEEKRFFFGAMGGIHSSKISYVLESQISEQNNFRLYLGPYASYDIYRTDKRVINLYTSLQFSLYETMDISITDSASGENELRTYSGDFSIFPNIGGNYHMRKSFFVFDTVIGFNMKFHLPRSYSTVEATTNDDLWQDTSKADSFKQTFRTELTYYFGIQSDY